MTAHEGHGWWPYLLPLFLFLGLGELAGRFPEAWQSAFLPLKVLAPGGLFLWFRARGAYPELRGYPARARDVAQDVAVGVAGAALWMAPYLLALGFDPPLWNALPGFFRPDPGEAFDPAQWGPGLAWLALGVRALGYAAVTPFVEELFVRSWLARYADVFDRALDFRDVPLGRYSRRSFWVVVVFFTLSHMPWEWPVAILWVVGTQLWFYHRKHPGPGGQPLDLWFFL
jgi:hypothetical protein